MATGRCAMCGRGHVLILRVDLGIVRTCHLYARSLLSYC